MLSRQMDNKNKGTDFTTSSAMGSPHSVHGIIFGFDNFGQGNEYDFGSSGMEDPPLSFQMRNLSSQT
jgi:hypothetical protein